MSNSTKTDLILTPVQQILYATVQTADEAGIIRVIQQIGAICADLIAVARHACSIGSMPSSPAQAEEK